MALNIHPIQTGWALRLPEICSISHMRQECWITLWCIGTNDVPAYEATTVFLHCDYSIHICVVCRYEFCWINPIQEIQNRPYVQKSIYINKIFRFAPIIFIFLLRWLTRELFYERLYFYGLNKLVFGDDEQGSNLSWSVYLLFFFFVCQFSLNGQMHQFQLTMLRP